MDLTVATSQLCKLSNAIDEIYNQNASALSFEELHRTAYNLVLQKHGDILYDGISKAIKTHLTQSSIEISQCSSDNLISLTVSKWLYHRTAFTLIKDVLMYMDRSYVKINKKLPVYENSLQLFKNIIILHPLIRDRLKKSVVSEINNERLGIIIDRNAIKNVLSMYCDLGNDGYNFYEVEFEQYFLEMSKEFYISESLDYLTNNNLSDYLKKAELRINEEITRANTYLSISSLSSIRLSTEYCFLITHYKVILDIDTTNGLLIMLNENKLDDLHRLYKLSYRINICLEQLREVISSYMKMKLTEIFNNNEEHKDSIKFVQLIINLKNKFDNLIVNAFDNDKVIQKLQKDCFELILNKDTRFALHLSCYLDNLLKSGFNSASEQYIDIELDNIIIIFKFLLDKDIFEDYYKKSLAKRLLSNKTVSDEAEKLVISKFKAECGYQFTNKMEGMFVDINNSKVIMDEFRSSNLYHQLEVEVELKTLSNGFWPFPTQTEFHLPVQLTNSYEKFKEFYMSNTNRSMRKLSLMSNMGSVDMKVSRTIILSYLSPLIVMMMFFFIGLFHW